MPIQDLTPKTISALRTKEIPRRLRGLAEPELAKNLAIPVKKEVNT